MVSRDLFPEMSDILNESEEIDQEYLTIPLSAMIPFEDLHNEMDIERYYRKMSSMKITGSNPGMHCRRHKNSKHVQTDPEVSNVPASWLLEGGKLIEELYTGLGNIINVMYHNPENFTSAKANKEGVIDDKGIKYFKYDNGYWQSTLLPNIRIPDRMEIDRQNRPLFSEDFKRKLHSLFDVATKLRNIVPYVTNVELQQNVQTTEDKVQFCPNEKSTQNLKRNRLPSLDAGPSEPNGCDMDFETCSDSGKSSLCSPEYCDRKRNKSKRVRRENSLETGSVMNTVQDDSHGFEQIPGVQVSKYTLKHQPARSSVCNQNSEPSVSNTLRSRDKGANATNSKRSGLRLVGKSVPTIATSSNTASCSNDSKFGNASAKVQRDSKETQRREKHIFSGQENHAKNQPHHSGSQINFIKRNIMATKNKTNRVGSSVGGNERNNPELSQNLNHRRVLQSTIEKIRNSLR